MNIQNLNLESVSKLLEDQGSTPLETVRLIDFITKQSSSPTANPAYRTWTQKLAEVREKGYKPWEIDELLGFNPQKLQNDGLYRRYQDPLDTVTLRLDVRIHHALRTELTIRSGRRPLDWLEFLVPAVTTNEGLFHFMNAGRFVLLQEEPNSPQIFPIITFTEEIDDLCLNMDDPNYSIKESLQKYSVAFHSLVSRPLGFEPHAAI